MKMLASAAAIAAMFAVSPALANDRGQPDRAGSSFGSLERTIGGAWRTFFAMPRFDPPGRHFGWFFGRHFGWFRPHNPHWPHEPPVSP